VTRSPRTSQSKAEQSSAGPSSAEEPGADESSAGQSSETKPGGTKQRIQAVARELFTQQGVQKTSLQEIADRLGITKPALYYHFSSREDLVRSILAPLIDEGERFVAEQEGRRKSARATPRELLEGYFDFHFAHRADLFLILAELTTLAEIGLIDRMLAWRGRLAKLIWGAKPTLKQSARAVIALGGIQDCCLQFPDTGYDELKRATIDGAIAALGI
jgi:AcrR family transcriptional regulator